MADTAELNIETILDATLAHVAFDGWSDASFRAALADLDLSYAEARTIVPRGAVDLAIAYHRRCDRLMLERLKETDLSNLRFSEKVAAALHLRIEVMDDREAVRRATALFSLPMHAAEGAKLIWETADHVWTALGDTSEDMNWYTKRATLSGVWASTILFWLGDDSHQYRDTQAFIDRRIADVMRIEKVKGRLRDNPLSKPFMELQASLFKRVKMPSSAATDNLPGRWQGPR